MNRKPLCQILVRKSQSKSTKGINLKTRETREVSYRTTEEIGINKEHQKQLWRTKDKDLKTPQVSIGCY